MASKSKIKIVDDTELRNEIEENTELINQINLAEWAISVAKHVRPYLEKEIPQGERILKGIETNELWQKGEATVHQVRQAGFIVHEVARECKEKTAKVAARAIVQAVGVGHMRGHAMRTTDYAIKTINLAFKNDMKKITEEREWQLDELNRYTKDGKLS